MTESQQAASSTPALAQTWERAGRGERGPAPSLPYSVDRAPQSAPDRAEIETRTQAIGRALYARMLEYRPSPLETVGDEAMVLLAEAPHFRARLLRFIDALASLRRVRSDRHVQELLREYLASDFPLLPVWLQAAVPIARWRGWPAPLVAETARGAARMIASRFIAAGGGPGLRRTIGYLRAHRRYPSFDMLGEYVASEKEADAYCDRYLELLGRLARAPEAGRCTPGAAHALQVSVKLSSLTSDFNPLDPAGTLARVRPRLTRILDAARSSGVSVTLDMERYETRDLVQRIFSAVCARGTRFGDWDGIGVVLQAYLRDANAQATDLLRFAEERETPFQIRLVKGAYWDYETVVAEANGWPAPVWQEKSETDATYERLSERLIAEQPRVRVAIASHNLRSHAHAEAVRETLGLPAGAIEHQVLYRTAEGVARALTAMGWSVRDYVPLGDLLPGMAYLVRRILENSSQAGFLLHSRAGESAERLLAPPQGTGDRGQGTGKRACDLDAQVQSMAPDTPSASQPPEVLAAPVPDTRHAAPAFRNQAPARLFLAGEREAFAAALDTVRSEFGRTYLLRLGDDEIRTADVNEVRDPSHPEAPPIGFVHNARESEVARALAIAGAALKEWSARPVAERAAILRRAADLLAARRNLTAAWIVYEAAKSRIEALADVDEAIDYLRYYAQEAELLAEAWRDYRPRGIVAVIPPWNFPIAIACGMTSAALVTGNTVILKPAEQTPLIAGRLAAVLHEAGVPEDVLIWLPGRGEVVGQALVSSPWVDMVAFTGSRAVGTAIYREGSRIAPARGGLRATIAEMGGKNAILVFADADLDEAVVGTLQSAFGHANQKCSAASRVLIQEGIYQRLRQRLVEGAQSLPTGRADEPGTLITPLIDAEARERVHAAALRARGEGNILLDNLAQPQSPANGPVLVEFTPQQAASACTTQEEIFGPVLALIPFRDEREAVRIANDTPYALTAGVFSRSPATVSRVIEALDAGNVYVNRPTTGARVGVEPFGGRKLSGTGPKAGGREYLWAFVTSRAGYRDGSRESSVVSRSTSLPSASICPWKASPVHRGEVIGSALSQQKLDRLALRLTTHDSRLTTRLLQRLPEIARPEATLPLPGQQSSVRWDTPRGCGLVLVDEEATTENLLALIVAPLLAGNGVIIQPDADRRPQITRLLEALRHSGLPESVAWLAPEGLDLTAAAALPQITFAAVDLSEAAAREIRRLLADASATPASPYLKALISLADGPGPEQPGFLRRFALPKTVAIRTLHLGADLELVDTAGE